MRKGRTEESEQRILHGNTRRVIKNESLIIFTFVNVYIQKYNNQSTIEMNDMKLPQKVRPKHPNHPLVAGCSKEIGPTPLHYINLGLGQPVDSNRFSFKDFCFCMQLLSC